MVYIVTFLMTSHGVWIGNWIYWTLKLVITHKYNVLANSHTLKLAKIYIKCSQFAFPSHHLVTDSNNLLFRSRRYRLVTLACNP
jgi:hypothetical protein